MPDIAKNDLVYYFLTPHIERPFLSLRPLARPCCSVAVVGAAKENMSVDGSQAPFPVTPTKKPSSSSQSRCCADCPCMQFKLDGDVTSAVDTDTKTAELVDWLSGTWPNVRSDGHPSSMSQRCANRLRVSIVILNSIRDACRPFLESAISVQSPIRSPSARKSATQQFTNLQATYEDSFPSLSSGNTSTSVAPTILFGRKKKNDTRSSIVEGHTTQRTNGANSTKNRKIEKQEVNYQSASLSSPSRGNGTQIHAPKVTKKVKPVTISLATNTATKGKSCSPLLSNGFQSALQRTDVWAPKPVGNISSLNSEDTSDMLRSKLVGDTKASHTTQPASVNVRPKLIPVVPIEPTNLTGTIQTGNSDVDSELSDEKISRLVRIYSTILKQHLAPFLLLELHLLLRLISLSDKQVSTAVTSSRPLTDTFQSAISCNKFAARTLTSVSVIILNLGHETIKMFASVPAVRKQCPDLVATLRSTIEAGKPELMFETDQKALGTNANTPHLTLPFDHSRDSRHNYRSVDLNRLYKEREELKDSFLYQLRAFQDVRGRLIDQEGSEKVINSIKRKSREMLQSVSSGNVSWFVNFFCDLLLQIGLVPIGETDSEVLKQVADQKRLQVSVIDIDLPVFARCLCSFFNLIALK